MMPGYQKLDIRQEDGLITVTLRNTKGNIVDREMMLELTNVADRATADNDVKAILFRGDGKHFSFGASVPEHQKDQVADMLRAFHGLFRQLIAFSRPLVAVTRGQCLGGGLELAAFCNWIFASPDARFGQPEINLAVFPPVASLILPLIIGQHHADDVNLSGRSLTADEARHIGLVHSITDDPDQTALAFLREHILPKSAVALKYAVQASRWNLHHSFALHIDALETMYLTKLMNSHDANEGITAFIERRNPTWKNN